MRGKERAFEGSATVWNGGSVVVAAAAAAGGGGLRYQVKGGPKRRAPESGERATRAGDVALRLQTNHSKQRFAAETAQLFPAALHSFWAPAVATLRIGTRRANELLEKDSRRS